MKEKVVLAYSGGLDTTAIIPWLKGELSITMLSAAASTVGQGNELDGLEERAKLSGAEKLYILKMSSMSSAMIISFPAYRLNAVYENKYLLGTSMARPLIAKKPGRNRPQGRRSCHLPRRYRQGQRPGPFRAGHQGSGSRSEDHRSLAL